MEPGEHLFRREAGRMIAALTRIFGLHNLALAEDVVQDAFCRALEIWQIRGVPENPSAWLMRTAKNRAIDLLRRERTARDYAPELGRLLESEWTLVPTVTELFGAHAIKDDQLRMMFSCCQPRLSQPAQIALVLQLVCGFTTGEIASAFLSGRAGIEKRISRAKKVLASSQTLFDLAAREFSARLSAVHRALYLLFNEGYHGASPEATVRAELCREAMRLGGLLLDHPLAATPETYALCALMHLHAARLPARVDDGSLASFFEQDRSRWDAALIARGEALLERSARGAELTEYHVEAAIASVHARARRAEDTDWGSIVGLYDTLLKIRSSPVVALNRAIAIAQHEGPERGLEEIRVIADRDRLSAYPFYSAALGELELRAGRGEIAGTHFRAALALARNPMERRFLEQRAHACDVSRVVRR
jgi:RNA polymerase sigma factor (sigma-70 family)